MPSPPTSVEGADIATLFATAVDNLHKKLSDQPAGALGAVDLEIHFKSLKLESKGFSFIWSNEQSTQSSLEIKLATRVYITPKT